MNNSTHFKSIGKVFTLLAMLSILFFTSCGGDDEATPDCSNLELSAIAEGNTITVSVTGGAAPFVYTLNNEVQSGTTFTDLEPGSYTMVVTDANECSDTQTVTIEDPCVGFIMTASGAGYAVAIEIEEGEAPFSYLISYGDDTEEGTSDERSFTVDLEEAEETTITVTDANGCEKQASLNAEQVRTFTDSRDGQTYQTIKIGNQIWFAENFNYNTNTADSTSSWYYNDDSIAYAAEYGRLYTWYVATSAEFAPEGWKVPSVQDFEDLEAFIGGSRAEVGAALRVEGNTDFDLKMGGRRSSFNTYSSIGDFSNLWSSEDIYLEAFDVTEGQLFGINSSQGTGTTYYSTAMRTIAGNYLRLLKK